jgi:hypothetical protein
MRGQPHSSHQRVAAGVPRDEGATTEAVTAYTTPIQSARRCFSCVTRCLSPTSLTKQLRSCSMTRCSPRSMSVGNIVFPLVREPWEVRPLVPRLLGPYQSSTPNVRKRTHLLANPHSDHQSRGQKARGNRFKTQRVPGVPCSVDSAIANTQRKCESCATRTPPLVGRAYCGRGGREGRPQVLVLGVTDRRDGSES